MNKETTRIRILLAAEKEFALKGIDGARVSTIVEMAGSSNAAAINYYFRSKQKLLAACLNYRSAVLDSFQEKLYNKLISESSNSELEFLQYYLVLIAPKLAAIKHCLPDSYYSRFMANYLLYAEANPQKVNFSVSPIAEICIRNIRSKMNDLVGEDKTIIYTKLHRNHLDQGVARLEAFIAHKLTSDKLGITDSYALLDNLTFELLQDSAFLALNKKATELNSLNKSIEIFTALCDEQLPFDLIIED
jgi:AcrR family transcriptional regulator